MARPTVLIVPGLRDAVPTHWQTLLEKRLRDDSRPVLSVPPLGREDLDCGRKLRAIEAVAQTIEGPMIIVAHSGGCIMVAHWAQRTQRAVLGALLAAPPDFEAPMPEGYPTLDALRAGGWLPVPRKRLPFPGIVAASRDDPLADFDRVAVLARDWGSRLVDLGRVGHLNPASGYGEWRRAEAFIDELAAAKR
jgi:predicted alpha/beta hydrolase family esterase